MMTSTPADKVKYLNETKAAIKGAIVAKGVEVAEDATFRSYADSIAAIDTKLPEQEKTIEITENGSYEVTPDEGYVMSKVTATVGIVIPEPVIEALEIVENGTYAAPAGVDGYSPITVNVPTGGGGEVEPIVLKGDCSYACGGALAGTYIDLFGNTITTSGITNASSIFNGCTAENIPFDINVAASCKNFNSIFYNCKAKSLPKINMTGTPSIPTSSYSFLDAKSLFFGCNNVREISEDLFPFSAFPDAYWEKRKELKVAGSNEWFYGCFSLRKVPMSFLKYLQNYGTGYYNSIYNGLCNNARSMDEIKNIPVEDTTYTSNAFSNFCVAAGRLKNITFEVNEDGSPKIANWKGQTITWTYSNHPGKVSNVKDILSYNSGITADKEVKDDATYQALKDDPDWFTCNYRYSRYNHDSAVVTINSLPDTSAYLAANGGTNTITFQGNFGTLTDGGAIDTLTEEEIAVATAKGWTIAFKYS